MLVHLLRRLGQSALVLLAVSFVSFMVFRHIGDPTISLLGEDATVAEREALTESLGFNKPVPLQYLGYVGKVLQGDLGIDRKSTRLNSSHLVISYAVFCLKKKKIHTPRSPAVFHPTSTTFVSTTRSAAKRSLPHTYSTIYAVDRTGRWRRCGIAIGLRSST